MQQRHAAGPFALTGLRSAEREVPPHAVGKTGHRPRPRCCCSTVQSLSKPPDRASVEHLYCYYCVHDCVCCTLENLISMSQNQWGLSCMKWMLSKQRLGKSTILNKTHTTGNETKPQPNEAHSAQLLSSGSGQTRCSLNIPET